MGFYALRLFAKTEKGTVSRDSFICIMSQFLFPIHVSDAHHDYRASRANRCTGDKASCRTKGRYCSKGEKNGSEWKRSEEGGNVLNVLPCCILVPNEDIYSETGP